MSAMGDIVFISQAGEFAFSNPVLILTATRLAEVKPCLQHVAEKVSQGLYAAGFLTYESAPAFDAALCAHPPDDLPLAWFGLYRAPAQLRPSPISDEPACNPSVDGRSIAGRASFQVGPWQALVSAATYHQQVRRIRDLIVAGDTYQINYTFPLQADFQGDTLDWFRQLCASQQADHCAFIQTGRFHLLSASPELFFKKDAAGLTTRPMKGTARRGRWPAEDLQAAQSLATSAKERAENVMIVDVLRNDMSRVSRVGSVNVARLWELERYPTVWQMTSTVVSQSEASVPDILAALFPSGSVTGAPKIRATEIIRALESYPRGIYCGTIGWWAPDGQAEFNVAIRTVTIDTETGTARYHVGGGITHGSSPEKEYAECLAKAEVLTRPLPVFDLLESLSWNGSYFLLREHLDRLAESAAYFDFAFSRQAAETALNQYPLPAPVKADPAGQGQMPILKIRLFLHRDGSCRVEGEPLKPSAPLRVGLAATPVDTDQIWLYHKTTCREIYRQALLSRLDCDDVILWNRRGEITESTIANVVLDLDGRFWTPPVACGLLAGTFRRHLLKTGALQERVLHRADLHRARAIHLINSVRRWMDVQWMDPA
ncbi:MAG: aminodeoxychorismate synthase component I [Verrucomicrobia bacterium]|nr:aminodeoxychorismate synthase component I [Verrucomicrobiota bacterium]MBU1734484.1 aminodeoxychorismate synthase component I [Verrucomicrobiota bacterium]MBU1856052.1 aminodeoxychorismate synthase component I [Verrucomicrobiota bacterium]